MKIYFWQNIISPHQIDLIKEVSKSYNVELVVERETNKFRSDMNWSVDTQKVNTTIIESDSVLDEKIKASSPEDAHVITGLLAYPSLKKAFRIISKKNNNIFIYTEIFKDDGIRGILNRAKYFAYRIMYEKKIKGLLCIGKCGCEKFKEIGFPEEKIHEYAYYINPLHYRTEENSKINHQKNYIQLLYVGRLVEYKGILNIIDSLKLLIKENITFKLNIIGDGPLKMDILKKIKEYNLTKNVTLHGSRSSSYISSYLQKSTILLLPNTKPEGWGVVINEALLSGLPVICSKLTGVSCVVQQEVEFGEVINNTSPFSIKESILRNIKKPKDRELIKNKALSHISPKVGAEKLVEIIEKNTT